MPNPWGDYGDVDLSSVYYGSQAAQSAQTGQPVANPDGSNAPSGVDPNTGVALPTPAAQDPQRDAAAADIDATVKAWLVSQGRDPTDGVTAGELVTILDQDQVDAAIQYGLFGPPGVPIGGAAGVSNSGYTKSTRVTTAPANNPPAVAPAPPAPPDPTNDYSQEIAALDKYIANKAGKQGTVTSADGSVTVSGALANDPQLKVYIDRRNEYAQRQAAYDKQNADYEAYRKTPAGMDPSANPVEGQRVLSTDPNARYTSTPTQNADGTVSFAGYTMAGSSGPKTSYYEYSKGQSMIDPNTIIGGGGGMGGNTRAQAQNYADRQTARVTRQYNQANPPPDAGAPAPPSNQPGSITNRNVPNRVTMPAPPANAPAPLAQVADQAKQMLGKINLPGRPAGGGNSGGPNGVGIDAQRYANKLASAPRMSRDFLKRITQEFDDVEIRIKRPRREDGVTIQPVPNEE